MLSSISRFGAKGMVAMPSLIGLTRAEAEALILSSGLRVGSRSSTSTSSSGSDDRVGSQAIAQGTLVDYETSVSYQYLIYVAPPPPEPTAPYKIGVTTGDCVAYDYSTRDVCTGSNYCFDTLRKDYYRAPILDVYSDGSTQPSGAYQECASSDEYVTGAQKCKVIGKCDYAGETVAQPTTTCSNYNTACSGNQYQTRRKCVDTATGATVSDTLVATYACGCTSSESACDSNGWKISYYTCYNPDGSTYGGSSAISCTSCGDYTAGSCQNGIKTYTRTCYTGGVASTGSYTRECCTASCGARYYFSCSNGLRHWTQICVREDCSEERVSGDDQCCYGQCGSWGSKTYVASGVYIQSRTCIDANCDTYTDTRTMCDAKCGSWTDTSSCTASPYGRYKNQKRTCTDAFCSTYTETRSIAC
jgi:hypothetical protein